MEKQTQPLPEKEDIPKDTTIQVSRALRGLQYRIRKPGVRRRTTCNYFGRGFTPVFRTAKAARFFGVTMRKGEDEAEEVTGSDCEREEEESRKRSSSPDVADELPSDVTEMELHLAKTLAAHAGPDWRFWDTQYTIQILDSVLGNWDGIRYHALAMEMSCNLQNERR
ncbi:hypothetical protein NA56DRAFT_659922 [Hyaloscypha hepaticicola]|uniref:Uncharacterized protein n=1 Tax=Hyaloscypha hepaticicola TaxID=2082293 RepID=A0A2J6Q2G1_9HELO|nr:hypothetical protein NA56DRAFT_659922 [Hyaloscypha hepaticicola]